MPIITCLRVSVSPSAGWQGSDLPRTVLLHTDNLDYLLHFSSGFLEIKIIGLGICQGSGCEKLHLNEKMLDRLFITV